MLIVFNTLGQELTLEITDTVEIKTKKKIFSGISITADIGKLIVGQTLDFEDKWAFSGHLLFLDHLQLSTEIGSGTINPENAFENVFYTVSGNFSRFGVDYVTEIKGNSNISFGLRRGSAKYEDSGTITIPSESSLSNDFRRSFDRPELEANWWELVLISETKFSKKIKKGNRNPLYLFAKNIYYGLNFRLKFNLDYPVQDDVIDTYTIPGYGRTFDKTSPAINLFIKYKLGF